MTKTSTIEELAGTTAVDPRWASLAKNEGFRPCKRCKPNQVHIAEQSAKKVAKACRLIERSEDAQSLKQLAGYLGISTLHCHRWGVERKHVLLEREAHE